jgi:hypothetical protein
LDSVTADGGAAHQRSAQAIHRLGRCRQVRPIDHGEIHEDRGFGDLPEIDAQRVNAM